MTLRKDQLLEHLTPFHQQHLLTWWDDLTPDQRQDLANQIQAIDFELIHRIWQASREKSAAGADNNTSRADTAAAPRSVVFQPQTEADLSQQQTDAAIGEQLLADGKVAVITVAGGQGSRLGFDNPKGMFPIGPVTDRTLFQVFAEQIQARKNRHGGDIPWLIMTSSATHKPTVDFFGQQTHFGLDPASIHFFQQGSMPAVDAENGKVLMADKATICLSPDGHGGLVTALESSGLLKQMANAGVEHIFYHQVDNPTVIMCDPALIGVHHRRESQLTTNVVRKSGPMEKMGVLVDVDGRLEIIEYSELTEEQASKEDEAGQWIFWAGNTAIHVFSRTFFEELASDGCRLELHVASKKVPHIDAAAQPVDPQTPNANKFERFIFDALPLAKNALIVEGDRAREFNPVKNADGTDSPATSRAALNRIGREWLASAGHSLPKETKVEISPLVALDESELAAKIAAGVVSVGDLTTG